MPWTLTHDGVTKTFAEWGLKGLKRSHASQVVSVASFEQSGADFDGEPLFPIDSVVTISNDAGVWHTGPVILAPREATARSESLSYQVACPWWYLEQLPFEQTIATAAGATATTRVVMFSDVVEGAVVKRTAEQVITAVVACAVAAGASMQVAFTGDFGVSPVVQEMRDPTCAEVIRAALKWVPDATSGWDFSTTPPTLRFARRSAATARTIDLADKQRVNLISLLPRADLKRDRVVLQYEITSVVDDETFVSYSTDAAGSGSAFRTLKATIPLSGAVKQKEKAWIKTAAIPNNNATWWKRHVPHLKDATDLNIHDHAEEPAEEDGGSFSYEILEGSVPGWYDEEVVSGPMRITCQADYSMEGEAGAEAVYKNDPLSAVVRCTSLSTGTYERVTSYTPGEPVPTGVAAALLAALGELQYDGSLRLRARECAFIARPGEVLNLTNGDAAWATARMQVQKVDEDISSGTTNITFGPAKHLYPQDIVEMLRTLRGRPPTYTLQERATGKKGEGTETRGPRDTQGDNGSGGGNHWQRVVSVSTDGTRRLTLDASAGVKAERDSGDKSMDIDNANQRILWAAPSGDSMDINIDRVLIQKAAGDSLELSATGLTLTKDGKTTTLSLLQLLHDDGAGKTANLNEEQLVLSSSGKLGTYEADTLSLVNGANVANVGAVDGFDHTDGTDTAELNAVRMQIIQGGDSATVTPEGGLDVVAGGNTASIDAVAGVQLAIGGGTVTITPVAGKDVSLMETEGCSDEGDPVTALVLRSLEVAV